jgi:predicted nuclease of predicted toxin-antitoxin system
LRAEFGVDATAIRDLGLREATDVDIHLAARKARAVVVTKDSDFLALLEQFGSPPQVVWITIGNCSNEQLRIVLWE